MSPGGHIGRQRGAVGAKCACSGTIARRPPAPCTQAKTQGRVTQRGGFEIVPGEYLMSTETYFVAPKCH